MSVWRVGAAIAVVAAITSAAARAQDFPSRPVKIIVPFAPGGPVDVLARALGEGFRQRTGQSVIVENKPGGNTSIGAAACKNAEPDGYTVCLLTSTTIVINPFLYPNLPYAPEKDLEPVTNVVVGRQVLLAHRDVPADSFAELVRYSQANPDKLNFGSFGIGGDSHLIVEWLNNKTGARTTHVPYPGAAPATVAFERGDVQLMFPVATPPITQKINSGQAKGLLVAGRKRDPNIPQVPTFKEAGLPELDYETWFGMFAPAGTPRDRVDKLSQEFAATIKTPSFLERYVNAAGYDAVANTPAEFKNAVAKDRQSGQNLVQISGVKIAP